MERLRRWGNGVLRGMVNTLYGAGFTDLCYGYIVVRRSALASSDLQSDGFEIEAEILVRALNNGLWVSEIASFESPRAYGTSNLNTWRDGSRVLSMVVRHCFSPSTARRRSTRGERKQERVRRVAA